MDIFLRREPLKEFPKTYPITTLFIFINSMIYLGIIVYAVATRTYVSSIFEKYAFSGVGIGQGEWYRLITGNFLHNGILHLLCNMAVMYGLAPFLEKVYGKIGFFFVYLLLGIGTGGIAFLLKPTFLGVGASGILFGMLGFYVAVRIRDASYFSAATNQSILAILIVSPLMMFIVPNISHLGHFAGFVTGFIVGLISFTMFPKRFAKIKDRYLEEEEEYDYMQS